MPFTPFHMGPGLVFKAVAGKHFSLLAFGVAQVAMDIEPLIGMVFGFEVLHGPTHTYLAAFIIGVLVSFIAPPIIRPILQRWDQELRFYRLGWLFIAFPLSRLPIAVGAFAGTFSHVALDSVMHSEMTPLAPWSNSNSLLGLVSMSSLYQLCVIVGAFGLALYLLLAVLRGRNVREG